MEQAPPRRARRLALALGCAAIAAGKLWLVAPDEIVARAYPLDQQRYAETTRALLEGRWLGAYDHTTLIRLPAYPLWAAAAHAAGVPLRTAHELLLIAASGLFAGVLLRIGQPPLLALAAFALLVLQPHSLVVNRELLAAGFYLPVLLAGLAGLLLALAARRRRGLALHATWTGLVLGVLWNTRPERPLVALLPAAAAVWGLAAARAGGAPWRGALARGALLAALPAAGIAAVSAGLAAINRVHYGVFVTSELSAPGFVAANRALLSIEHAAPRRFVPVPAEVRQRAYAVSPALRELAPYLETPGWAHAASCSAVEVCDDVGGGWFVWWLRDAARRAGRMPSAPRADAFFQRVADELAVACARGALACRRRPRIDFLHPYPRSYLPHLPDSLARVVARMASAGEPRDWDLDGDLPWTPEPVRALFDEAARRDPARTSNGHLRVEGSATAQGDPVVSLSLGRGVPPPRPDDGAFARPPAPVGAALRRLRTSRFALDLEKPTRELAAMRPVLRLVRRSGAALELRLPEAGAAVEREGVRLVIDRIEETGGVDPRRRALRRALFTAHAWLLRGLVAGGLVAGVALLLPPWRGRAARPALGALVLIALTVAARVGVLALVDASSFPARSSRYVYPVVSLAGIAGLLAVREALARWLRTKSPRPPAATPR